MVPRTPKSRRSAQKLLLDAFSIPPLFSGRNVLDTGEVIFS